MINFSSVSSKALFATIAAGAVLLTMSIFVRTLWQPTALFGCPAQVETSSTIAASYFTHKLTEKILSLGQPVEGYEPAALIQAYPRLELADFHCVQTNQGLFAFVKGELVFRPNSRSERTSSEKALTPQGFATVLENVARRMRSPITTISDVDAVLSQLETPEGAIVPTRKTLTGEYTCLQPRDPSGVHTMECALGLKLDDGTYVALDLNLSQTTVPTFATGDRLQGTGLFTPVEMLSTDHWQKYNMIGIFSVTDGLKKLP